MLPATCSHVPLGTPRLCFQRQVPCLLSARSADLAFLSYTESLFRSLSLELKCSNASNPHIAGLWAGHFIPVTGSSRPLHEGESTSLHWGCPIRQPRLPSHNPCWQIDPGRVLFVQSLHRLVQGGTWPTKGPPIGWVPMTQWAQGAHLWSFFKF